MGVERAAEKTLRGRRGYRRRRGDGTVIEEVLPLDGEDVKLAIDIRLQGALTELWRGIDARVPGDQTGAMVIVDVASSPSTYAGSQMYLPLKNPRIPP